jgi:hypothetical protein
VEPKSLVRVLDGHQHNDNAFGLDAVAKLWARNRRYSLHLLFDHLSVLLVSLALECRCGWGFTVEILKRKVNRMLYCVLVPEIITYLSMSERVEARRLRLKFRDMP